MKKTTHFQSSPFAPRHWLTWAGIGILWLVIQLPYRWQLRIGKALGLLALRFAKREKRTTQINLRECFPHYTEDERKALMRRSFINMGIGALETAFGWWASEQRLKKLITIQGYAHIQDALKKGKGVLIFTAHCSCLHICGRLLTLYHPFSTMFFPPKNLVFRYISLRAMRRYYQAAIPRDEARQLIRALKNNHAVLYMPDTDAKQQQHLFVPFFGVPAATLTATAKFAHLTHCKVLQATCYRRNDEKGYVVHFHPSLANYPTEDPYHDALRINQHLEEAIIAHPEFYLWQYKRFKTRPPGEKKFYA